MAELIRKDFEEEGHNQWVAHKQGFRVVVRRYDGGYELVIRGEINSNPTQNDWEDALRVINLFYQQLRLGQSVDMRTLDADRPPE